MIEELGTKLFSQVSIILSLDYSPASAYSLNAFRNSNNAYGYKLNINMSLLRVKLHKIIKVISMQV